MPETLQHALAAARPAREPTYIDGLDATVSEHSSASADDQMGVKGAALGAAHEPTPTKRTIVETLQRELDAADERAHTAEEALVQATSALEALQEQFDALKSEHDDARAAAYQAEHSRLALSKQIATMEQLLAKERNEVARAGHAIMLAKSNAFEAIEAHRAIHETRAPPPPPSSKPPLRCERPPPRMRANRRRSPRSRGCRR